MALSVPDRRLIRLYGLAWVAGYLVAYFFLRDLFPEKSLTDSLYIQEIIEGSQTQDISQGFRVMALLFGLLPQSLTWALVGLFDAFVLYKIAEQVRTFRGMLILPVALFPFVGLNLQAPTKETMVIALSMALYALAKRSGKDSKLLIAIVALYALYGLMVRDYYLLILGTFIGLAMMAKSPAPMRIVYLFPVLALFLAMPESVYLRLGNARNEVNFAIDFGLGSEVRTYFLNPFPSDNFLHFLGNYVNALAMLNFPFLKAVTLKEAVLFVNVLFYAVLLVIGMTRVQGPQRWLAVLFAAHIIVLTIFEPDYGSYFRHFSSVLLYLLPALTWLEERRAHALLARQQAVARPCSTP